MNKLSIYAAYFSLVLLASNSALTTIRFAGTTFSAITTAAVAATFVISITTFVLIKMKSKSLLIYVKTFPKPHIFTFFLLWTYSIYSFVSLLVYPSIPGAQNYLSFVLFIGGITFWTFFLKQVDLFPILRFAAYATFASSFIALFSFVLGIPFFDNRAFAMTIAVGLAATVLVPPTNFVLWMTPYITFLAILFSASRTATIAGLVVIGLSAFRANHAEKNFIAIFLTYVAAFSTTVLAYLFIPKTNERLSYGDSAISIKFGAEKASAQDTSQIIINSSGRFDAWQEFLGTLQTSQDWLIGRGTGSSAVYGRDHLPAFPQVLNEYLRILLDTGLVGLIIFVSGLIMLFIALRYRKSEFNPFVLSGLAVLVVVTIISFTDGQLTYPFCVLPSALFIGIALNRSNFTKVN